MNATLRIKIKFNWNKVDSHIETRKYKPAVKPTGVKISIWLNKKVDIWPNMAREVEDRNYRGVDSP